MEEKKTERPRYGLGQNSRWMLRQAAEARRYDVPALTLIKALSLIHI